MKELETAAETGAKADFGSTFSIASTLKDIEADTVIAGRVLLERELPEKHLDSNIKTTPSYKFTWQSILTASSFSR